MKKTTLVLLLFFGIILIIIDITKNITHKRQDKIIYRYIPRTFDEEQNDPTNVSDIFQTMFSLPSPWIASISNVDFRKQEEINKYFASQV
jgi:hypothetical protein